MLMKFMVTKKRAVCVYRTMRYQIIVYMTAFVVINTVVCRGRRAIINKEKKINQQGLVCPLSQLVRYIRESDTIEWFVIPIPSL